MALGAKMDLNLKRLSLADARLEILTRTEADLHAQFFELTDLREQFREAQVSPDLKKKRRAHEGAPQLLSPQSPSVCGWSLPVTLFPERQRSVRIKTLTVTFRG
jgi:hypothetical protein